VRIRQHVNPLKSDFFRIPLGALALPAGVAVEVELGSAEAWFLMERALAEPGGYFVGVEIRRDVAAAANIECERRGLPNVHSVFANMSVDLSRLFAPGSVRRFHLNFPDPWWKSRQHKRRVVGPALVAELAEVLEPGGEIHVMTDIFDIALEAMATLEEAGPHRFVNARAPWSFYPDNPWGARSRRERQCEADGTRVWRLLYRLAGPSAAA